MNNVYLVGFMGTGKSAVGRQIAKLKKSEFVDLDELIEKKENQSIPDIFTQKGEAYFRQAEKTALNEISQKNNLVVSCGGGIVIERQNIALMKKTGKIICLTATLKIILERTRGLKHRPLLDVADPKAKIESLLAERAPFYAQADKTIDTSFSSVNEVADLIIKYTN
jgi:shikimate kinase